MNKFYGIAGVLVLGIFSWWQENRPPANLTTPPIRPVGSEVRLDLGLDPFAVAGEGIEVERLDDNRVRIVSSSGRLSLPLADGEAVYGLTERIVDNHFASETNPREVGGLDRRGEIVTMWVRPTIAAYAPFYISSRGYGLYVENMDPGWFDIGKTDPDKLVIGFETSGKPLSLVLIRGSYLEVLDRYTAMTGRPFLPPRWVFLPWKWRGECGLDKFADLDGVSVNAEVADDITMYEKLGFPTGVYLIDRPWAEGAKGYGNFVWDPHRFPNGDAMVKRLQTRGWHVVVWGAPWAMGNRDFEQGKEARELGLVIGDRNLDYTNPAAVEWHVKQISDFVRRSGVEGWKLDRGDEYNPSRKSDRYFDGRTGFEVHNDYVRMYIKVFHDATRLVRGDDFVLMARPAYTGTSAWSIVWGGDTYAREYNLLGMARSTDLGLRSTIISLQRMAFMGYPTWGSDTGGYHQFKDREVFARWLEFSCFCPMMEIGGVNSHEPWNMPTDPAYDDEMIAIYKKYTLLHAALADYSHALAERAHAAGNPIVHPLVFDWPDDPLVADMWDEYMYGPALLVAPVWRTGERSREVYLPAGEWMDFWDREREYHGPATITADAPLDLIPVYVKKDQAHRVPADGN